MDATYIEGREFKKYKQYIINNNMNTFNTETIYNILTSGIWQNNYFVLPFFLSIAAIFACLGLWIINNDHRMWLWFSSLAFLATALGVVVSATFAVTISVLNVCYSNQSKEVARVLSESKEIKIKKVCPSKTDKNSFEWIEIEADYVGADNVLGATIKDKKASVILTEKMIDKLDKAGYKLNINQQVSK